MTTTNPEQITEVADLPQNPDYIYNPDYMHKPEMWSMTLKLPTLYSAYDLSQNGNQQATSEIPTDVWA